MKSHFIILLNRKIGIPAGNQDEHDPKVYEKAAENFQMFQDKAGWCKTEKKIIMYMHNHEWQNQYVGGRSVCSRLYERVIKNMN